jgi:sorting nexin-29
MEVHTAEPLVLQPRYWMKNGSTMRQYIIYSYIDFLKTCDSIKREVLYNILVEFRVPMKLVRLIKMSLNEMYCNVCIGKHLSGNSPVQNGLKQGDALLLLFFNFVFEYVIRKAQENQVGLKLNGTYQLLICNSDVYLLENNIYTIKKNTGTLIYALRK